MPEAKPTQLDKQPLDENRIAFVFSGFEANPKPVFKPVNDGTSKQRPAAEVS
jgi:hypothetical protein